MTFEEYQIQSRRTQNRSLPAHFMLDHALFGLCSEVGEIQSIYQKMHQGHPINIEKVADEMGDVLWFLAELADCIGVSLSSIARGNVEKLDARYPDGFDAERSLHRGEAPSA